jgi:shikimate kinase
MNKIPNLILVGFMGTGKTTVGKIVASRLNMEFVDMDDVIEQRRGETIPQIFERYGEKFFRQLEHELVIELARRQGLVISTGGGIVLNQANIQIFSQTGVVICLQASPETVLQRVGNDPHRPLLAGSDRMSRIRELLERRRPYYNAIPYQVDTNELTIDEVVEKVINIYKDVRKQKFMQ